MALVEQRLDTGWARLTPCSGLNAETMETVSIPTLSLFNVEPPVYTTYTDNNLPVSKALQTELRKQPHTKSCSQASIQTVQTQLSFIHANPSIHSSSSLVYQHLVVAY